VVENVSPKGGIMNKQVLLSFSSLEEFESIKRCASEDMRTLSSLVNWLLSKTLLDKQWCIDFIVKFPYSKVKSNAQYSTTIRLSEDDWWENYEKATYCRIKLSEFIIHLLNLFRDGKFPPKKATD
jgi:hypothetical protein